MTFIQKDDHWFVDITGTLEYEHVKIKDQGKSDTPKTASSVRSVVLPQKAVQIYQKLKRNPMVKGLYLPH